MEGTTCKHCGFTFKRESVALDHQETCDGIPEGMSTDEYYMHMTAEQSRLDERHKCPRCDGVGSIANPVFDGMGTSEIYDDMGYDEGHEFLEEYTKPGGMYDILCPCCKGQKVVTQRRIEEFDQDEAYRLEVEAEQRMMGMGRY
jgi:hypothetical protein